MKVMRFAMKFDMIDPVCDHSLQNIWLNGKKIGYSFNIRLNYYRGHFLSVIDEFSVAIDGQEIPPQDMRFEIHGKSFGICELQECYTEFWNILDEATVVVHHPGGLAPGDHSVELNLYIRSPYMATGPDHQYMPVDCCGGKTLTITEEGIV